MNLKKEEYQTVRLIVLCGDMFREDKELHFEARQHELDRVLEAWAKNALFFESKNKQAQWQLDELKRFIAKEVDEYGECNQIHSCDVHRIQILPTMLLAHKLGVVEILNFSYEDEDNDPIVHTRNECPFLFDVKVLDLGANIPKSQGAVFTIETSDKIISSNYVLRNPKGGKRGTCFLLLGKIAANTYKAKLSIPPYDAFLIEHLSHLQKTSKPARSAKQLAEKNPQSKSNAAGSVRNGYDRLTKICDNHQLPNILLRINDTYSINPEIL